MSKIKFMNIEIDNCTIDGAITQIDNLINSKKKSYVVTPNVDHIIMLQSDKEFLELYHKADLVFTDGMPLIWISKLYHNPIVEKISGSDLFPKVCELASKKNYTMFFLGAAEGVAAKAAQNLKSKYEGLQVIGTYSPPYGFEKNDKEIDKIIEMINLVEPTILILGLGSPKQEKFIYKYRDKINVNISFGLGASLDFEAGNVKRAPKWMRNHGLEWLYRITQDPKRLFKRYVVDIFKITGIIFKYRERQ